MEHKTLKHYSSVNIFFFFFLPESRQKDSHQQCWFLKIDRIYSVQHYTSPTKSQHSLIHTLVAGATMQGAMCSSEATGGKLGSVCCT